MGLKSFHIFFIVLSIFLSGGFAAWAFVSGLSPIIGILSLVATAGLILYGVAFLKKSKHLII